MNREPLLTVGVITTLVSAVLVLLTTFGVPITAQQQDAINAVVAIVAPIALAIIARQYVTPVSSPRDNEGNELVPK